MKLTKLEWIEKQNKSWEELNQIQRICPCCREIVVVDILTKLSIFINTKICWSCARSEKATPKFNWVVETKMRDKVLREEVIRP